MKFMSIRGRWLIGLGMLMLLIGSNQTAFAQGPTLGNPGFEEPYSGGLAQNWSPWHEERNTDVDCNNESMFRRPSWSAEIVGGQNGQLLFEGIRSQHVGNQFATWRAGVFQAVNGAVSGGQYRFSVQAWGRASQDQYPAASDRAVDFTVRVGIDPTGGGVWNSGSIIWGPTISPHDAWQTASVEATALGDSITVFIDANFAGPGHCRKHLDIWFDAASLESTAPAPTNTPIPQPTNTPVPSGGNNGGNTGGGLPVATSTPGGGNNGGNNGGNTGGGLPVATNTPVVRSTNTPRPLPTNTPFPSPTPLPTGPWFTPTPVPVQPTALPTGPWFTPTPAPPTATPFPVVVVVQQPVATAAPVQPAQPVATAVPPTEAPTADESAADEPAAEESAETEQPPEEAAPEQIAEAPVEQTQPQGGTICVNTFSDANGNGQRDGEEGYMAGIPIFIGQNGVVIAQGSTSGSSTAVCFEGLEPAEYEVAQRLPGSLEMTTAGSLTIPIEQGQQIGLEFGSRVRQIDIDTEAEEVAVLPTVAAQSSDGEVVGETATAGQSQTAPGNNLDTLSIAGIVILGLAVVLLGGILVALLRR